jgi:hypothetical protein
MILNRLFFRINTKGKDIIEMSNIDKVRTISVLYNIIKNEYAKCKKYNIKHP